MEGNLELVMRIATDCNVITDFDDNKVNDVINVFATEARQNLIEL